jgi:hypothetical protein
MKKKALRIWAMWKFVHNFLQYGMVLKITEKN